MTERAFVSRMISALVCGLLFGRYIHHDYMKWNQRGRDAFLAFQANRFDHFMSPPHAAWITVTAMSLVVILFLAVYELVALGISKMFRPDASS